MTKQEQIRQFLIAQNDWTYLRQVTEYFGCIPNDRKERGNISALLYRLELLGELDSRVVGLKQYRIKPGHEDREQTKSKNRPSNIGTRWIAIGANA